MQWTSDRKEGAFRVCCAVDIDVEHLVQCVGCGIERSCHDGPHGDAEQQRSRQDCAAGPDGRTCPGHDPDHRRKQGEGATQFDNDRWSGNGT